MECRIGDAFTDHLAKLTGNGQKLDRTTTFALQLHPANPGMQFPKIDRVKDPTFWPVPVGNDLRLIVHKTEAAA